MSDETERQEDPSDGVEGSLAEFVTTYLDDGALQTAESDRDPRGSRSGWGLVAVIAIALVVLMVAVVAGRGMSTPEPSRLTQQGYDVQVRPALVAMSAQLRDMGLDAPNEDEIPLVPSGTAQQIFESTGDRFWVDLDPILVAASGEDDDAVLGIVSMYDTYDGSLSEVTYDDGRINHIGGISIRNGADFWQLEVEFNERASRSAHISVSTYQASS
jgi:hypothetical protein